MAYRITTRSPEQTNNLGQCLGKSIERSVGFLLAGSYGSGKTTFARGLAQGLGVEGLVRSPSYNILKVYEGREFQFIHADLYRLTSLPDIHELGLSEMLDQTAVVAVEWPHTVSGFSLDIPTVDLSFGFAEEREEDHHEDLEQTRVIELAFSFDCPPGLLEVASALTT